MKTMKPQFTLAKKICAYSLSFLLISCGANPFKSYEKEDPAEDATLALEAGQPDKAISILNKALEKDPQNYQFISILAMAYAEKAGIDAVRLALKMASNKSGSTTLADSSTTNGVTALFGVLPPATDANISSLDQAVALMVSIPLASMTTADKLKYAMFQTASMALRIKKFDKNGDGVISLEEALAMSGGDATAILGQIAGAISTFSSGSTISTTDKAASEQISSIQSKITGCPGSSDQERLQNYVSKTGC